MRLLPTSTQSQQQQQQSCVAHLLIIFLLSKDVPAMIWVYPCPGIRALHTAAERVKATAVQQPQSVLAGMSTMQAIAGDSSCPKHQ
jgi:hypothetical protein